MHFGTATDRSWPISDRLLTLNRSFRSKLPKLKVTVWPMPANGQRRPQSDGHERRLSGDCIGVVAAKPSVRTNGGPSNSFY